MLSQPLLARVNLPKLFWVVAPDGVIIAATSFRSFQLVASESYRQIAETAANNGLNQILSKLNDDNPDQYRGYLLGLSNIEDNSNIPENFFHPKAAYLLMVHGESMKDVGILDGDLLAVHRTDQVKNGDIVVARIEDEVTVKRFK